MFSIYRYEIHNTTEIMLPVGAKILKFGARLQYADSIEFWALVDTEAALESKTFRVVGTGHPFPDAMDWHYLDTVITAGGALVWHIFRVKQISDLIR